MDARTLGKNSDLCGTTSLLPKTFVLSLLQTSKSDFNSAGASTSVGSPSVVKTPKNEPPPG